MNVKPLKGFVPKLYIYDEALNKMNEYIEQCELEIGWLGCAKRVENNFLITDVFLFKQEVHSATTEITTEGLSEFAMELMENDQEHGMEIWNNLRVWGHSHVDMATSPSGQDEKQIDVFMENDNDFFIRLIGNKQGHLRVDIYDFKIGVQYSELEYNVLYDKEKDEKIRTISNQIRLLRERLDAILEPDKSLVDEISKEIASKVTEKVETYKYNNRNYSDYGYGYYGHYGKNYGTKAVATNNSTEYVNYFNTLTEEEIFEAMIMIEGGETSNEIFVNNKFTPYESAKLDDLIEDYCNTNINNYLNYVETMYN